MAVTGNIQPKNGVYYAVINLYDENGQRHQKWINTNLTLRGNKKAAEAFLNEQLAKYETVTVPYSKLTVAEYFVQWLEEMEGKVRDNTYRNYCGNMRNHIIPYFEAKKTLLQELTTVDLENYLRQSCKAAASSNRTRRSRQRRLNTISKTSARPFQTRCMTT